ncbi:8144_t:CDS:2 [Gigaspora rosea]|nr:8144_t:CDS:2 [Gigaspora rosea]
MANIFSEIPYEIVVKILILLPAKDLCSISLVNKNLLSFTQDDYVWQSICISRFPANRISEEQKNMIADEATSKIQETSNSESKNDEQQVTVSEHSEWKRLYKRLSKHINFIAKERGVVWLDCQDGGGIRHHWQTLINSQSEFGKVVYLKYVWWFDVSSTLKSVLPGTYDVVWRLKIDRDQLNFQNLNFRTTVIEKAKDEIDTETNLHNEQEYTHIPQSTTYDNIAHKRDWVEYCLPYKIVVPERKVVDDKLVYYDVHLKIYNHQGYLKSGLWIDYVRLREHDENRGKKSNSNK